MRMDVEKKQPLLAERTDVLTESSFDELKPVPLQEALSSNDADRTRPHSRRGAHFSFAALHGLFQDSATALVFQAGAAGLSAGLVHERKGRCVITALAHSRDVDFTRAIADILAQLKTQQRRLPKTALLITPNVLTSLVELPVSPLRPRPEKEMRELINWELEAALSQQNRQWMIGNILVERHYIAPAERDDILAQLAQRQQLGGQAAMVRFGDLAIELGYISAEQFRECLQLQGKLVAADDDAAYGWSTQQIGRGSDGAVRLSDEALKNRADDADSAYNWLVSGVSQAIRQRWLGAFALNGLTLAALYPVVGTGYASAYLTTAASDYRAVLEVYPQRLVLLAGSKSQLQRLAVQERKATVIQLDECLALLDQLPEQATTLQLQAPAAELDELEALLTDWVDIPVRRLPVPDGAVATTTDSVGDSALAMLGVASHYLKHIPASLLSSIKPRDREPNAWRRLVTPRLLLGVALSLGLGWMAAGLGWIYYETGRLQAEQDDLRSQIKRDRQLVVEYQRIHAERRGLAESINNTEVLLVDYRALVEQVELSLPRARLAVPGAMKGIVISASQGVQLRRLEKKAELIQLEALALSDSEGLEFVDMLNQWLKPVGFQVQTSEVFQTSPASRERRRKNFDLALPGLPYQVDITLAPYAAPTLALTAE